MAFDLRTGRRVWSAVAPAVPVRVLVTPGGRGVVAVGADGSVWVGVFPAGEGSVNRSWLVWIGALVGAGVGLGMAIGWLPAWLLAVIPFVAGAPVVRRVWFTVSWGDRGASNG
jgi:hypothetical protein